MGKEVLEITLKKLKSRHIEQFEVFLSSSKSLKIDVLNQEIEAIDEMGEIGCGIRIIKDKKLGFAYTSDFDKANLEETVDQAIENAKSSGADEFNTLPGSTLAQEESSTGYFDDKIAKTSVKKKIQLALQIEKAAYKTDNRVKKTEKASYSDSEREIWIVNSNGIDLNYKTNACGGYAQVIALHHQEMEAGLGINFVKKLDDFKPEKIGEEAAERATQLLGAKSISSQKMPMVLDPTVGAELLGALSSALSAEAVQKGKSLFADKIGKAVGSKVVSIIDNGRLSNGLATAPFDGEGVPTQETELIQAGILNTFLFHAYTANKGETNSTGNAVRASFKSLPVVGPTNLYLEAGSQSPDAIIKSINKGLYVTRVMGIHTANPISGDFSIGAAGIMIENGEKTFPVRGITIAGNLIEMLKGIEAIGSDLRFIVNLGSPTLLISDITLSGG